MQEKQCWEIVLSELGQNLSKANFQTWFAKTELFKVEDGEAHIAVPNDFVKGWLDDKYKIKTLDIMRNHIPSIRSVIYVVKDMKKDEVTEQKPALYERISQALPLELREDGLNPKYTFKSFIIGSFNELAYAASQAIIKAPGMAYNPLFIYGNTGLGKTHLIQASGNAIRENFPEKKILYTSIERFYNDYVNLTQQNKANFFKDKYRKYDVLMIDDVQFISGKDRTQEELFHLFNMMQNENKQIIFSSDKHPNMIIGLEDRLKSRFNSGMVVDVSNPEFEARFMIMREKTKDFRNLIDDTILSFISENVSGSIRELEGIINLIICHCELKKQPIHLTEIRQLIKNHITDRTSKKPEEIIELISKYYNTNPILIIGKTRRQDVVYPRQMTIFILREVFNISYQLIGEKLGGRDHTTIIHSYEKIKEERTTKPQIHKEIEEIRQIIN